MIYFSLFSLLLAIAVLFWVYYSDMKNSVMQYALILIIIASDVGFLSLALADTLPEAVLALKIIYVGGSFLPILYFMVVSEASHIKINGHLTMVLIMGQFAVYAVVYSIGITDWFYKSVELAEGEIGAVIVKEYGHLHFLYPLTMYGYFFAAIIESLYAFLRKKSVNKKDMTIMAICTITAVIIYVIGKGTDYELALVPFLFMILFAGVMSPIYHSNLFTTYENKEIVEENLDQIGFITFNKKLSYMGCNRFAEGLFPELKHYQIGRSVKTESEEFRKYIFNPLIDFNSRLDGKEKKRSHGEMGNFKIGERYYEGKIHTILNYRKRVAGFTIQIRDETEHQRALRLSRFSNEELEQKVYEKTARIRDIQEKTILGMAQMVESRDLSTGGHIKRTSEVVRIFARRLTREKFGLSKEFLNLVIRGASMHDLGKIGVDDCILRKQGKFTDAEYRDMKQHAEIGSKMLRKILEGVEEEDFVQVAENIAHYHHEKVDGSGYPEGLKGDEIPVEARIMALADVFDALVSKRCYKEAFSYDVAFRIIEQDAGTHFDPQLAEIFLKCRKELESYYENEKSVRSGWTDVLRGSFQNVNHLE